MLKRDNFNELYQDLITNVVENGHHVNPRGLSCQEVIADSFCLTNPLNCLCTITERKLNYAFTIIEKLEYLSGEQKPERLCFYNSNLSQFLNKESGNFDGAYGPRIGRQLWWIYKLLLTDRDTRQAVININNESDKRPTADFPCTLSLQFLLRDNKLNLVVNMRSNDLLWGTPYDVNAFCFLLEVMSKLLNVEVGSYYHFNGSSHYYHNTYQQLLTTMLSKSTNLKSNPAWDVKSLIDTSRQLSLFWEVEEKLRLSNTLKVPAKLTSSALLIYLNEIKNYCNKKHAKKLTNKL